MSVYLVVNSRIHDPELLDEYMHGIRATLGIVRMKVLAFDANSKTIEGEPPGPYTVIIEFESENDFRTWYDSPEYQALVQKRHAATTGFGILVNGR